MHHTNTHAEDEQAGSRTPAINIASRITQDADYGDDHDLVGSPEQVSELATYRSSPHLSFGYGSQDALPSRPGFGRSISSPQGISSMPTSSSPRFQTLFRKTQRPPKDREWSVFGELMSGEGRGERHLQVPSFSASSSFVRRGGHTPSSSSTTPIPTPAMEESGTLSLGDTVQSPVQDSQMAGTDNLPSFSSMEQIQTMTKMELNRVQYNVLGNLSSLLFRH
ncbi:hypothetical protein QCA50_003781 [Cerrena zonata]|uniref:Uncharacterized protein n=1 Tax=Cerrena zonata TaxID=2478898 RepID=A0AAW0GJU2_9APHY